MKKTLKKGFTLVELVIVIAVIAILSAVLIPTFGNVISNAKRSAAQSEASNAISQYVTNQAQAGADTNIADGYVIVLDKRATIVNAESAVQTWKGENNKNIAYVFECTKGAINTNDTVDFTTELENSLYAITKASSAATVGNGTGYDGTIFFASATETLTTYGVYLLDYKIENGVTAKVILLAKK